MKTRWLLAMGAAALLVVAGGAAFGQDRHDRDDHHEHHWDARHPAFDDHEHETVRVWWGAHQAHPVVGFRVQDRLPAGWEPRLQVGFVLDTGWRRRLHPLPPDLYRQFPPPPPHFTYYVIGGHVVLVDRRDWRVVDVIHVEL